MRIYSVILFITKFPNELVFEQAASTFLTLLLLFLFNEQITEFPNKVTRLLLYHWQNTKKREGWFMCDVQEMRPFK